MGRFRFKRRSWLLIAGAVLACVGLYAVNRHLAGRPRVYPEAWAEANDLLKEEVGAVAVERGILSIPQAALPVHDGTVATVSRTSSLGPSHREERYEYVVLMDGSHSCLTYEAWTPVEPHRLRHGNVLRIARLSRNEAAHIEAVLSYLNAIVADGFAENGTTTDGLGRYLLDNCSASIADIDASRGDIASSHSFGNVLELIRSRLSARYCARLVERGNLRFLTGEKEIAALAGRLLERALPGEDGPQYQIANKAIRLLAAYPRRESLPALMKARACGESEARWQKWANYPVVGWIIRRTCSFDGYVTVTASDAADAVAVVTALSGKSPGERFDLLAAREFSPGGRSDVEKMARSQLPFYWRGACPRMLLDNFPKFGQSYRVEVLQCAYDLCTDDPALARLAATDGDALVRARASYYLFRLTGNRAHLAACLRDMPDWDALHGRHDVEVWDSLALGEDLATAFLENGGLTEIPDFLREWLRALPLDDRNTVEILVGMPENVGGMLAALITAGGKDNVAVAMRMMDRTVEGSAGTLDGVTTGLPELCLMDTRLIHALRVSRDAAVADALLAYLEAKSANLVNASCDNHLYLYPHVAASLSGGGEVRALPILDAVIARFEGNHPGSTDDNSEASPDWHVPQAAATIRMRTAADPLEYLHAFPRTRRGLIFCQAADLLCERYTSGQLATLLVDDQHADLRSLLYLALVERRQIDALEGRKP